VSKGVRICGYLWKPKGVLEQKMLGNTALGFQLQTLRTFISSSSAITVTNIIIGIIAALSTVLAVLLILGAKRVSTATDSINL
jgi:hypothetical protein